MTPDPAPSSPATGRHTSAVLLAAALWGTTGTVAHHAPAGSSQALVGMGTFGFGALALLAVDARAVGRLVADRAAWPTLALGALGVGLYASLYYAAMGLVGVAVGNALALGSGPVFAALLELAVDRTPIGRAWAIATAVAVSGIALLAASSGGAPGPNPAAGVALALAAGFGYALYSWAGARLIGRGRGSRSVMAAIFTAAAVVLLPAFVLAGPGPLASGRGVLVLAYLALVPMALAYLLFGYGLGRLTASAATTLALAEPVVATVLATTVLHERLPLPGWLGLALIGVGLLLTAPPRRTRRRLSPPR